MKITEEIANLFRRCRSVLGAPLVEVELTDQQLCDLLSFAIEDYAEKAQNWVIENQWSTLYGKNLSNMELAYGLSVRTFDFTRDFSYWFSREAGFQQRGPWELKKDYVTIEAGKQNYIIPAGREINSIMYCNPPTTQAALYANYGGLDMMGFAGGYGQAGGGSYGPIGGFYIAQAMDVAYMATDLTYKTRLLRGDLTYKVTAGPDGTRILHLYSTPGSKLTFGANVYPNGGLSLVGCQVWYTYYDATGDDADECRRMNPDVIITPDQIPLSRMSFDLLNEPTKALVRKLFVAKAKETLGLIRGKYSGKVHIPMAEAQLDYQMLISQGQSEYQAAMDDLVKRLERMSPLNIAQRNADITDATIRTLGGTPMTIITA